MLVERKEVVSCGGQSTGRPRGDTGEIMYVEHRTQHVVSAQYVLAMMWRSACGKVGGDRARYTSDSWRVS